MRKRISREVQREDTRRRLLEAARRVFLRRGFHGATLDLVAEEAGFTKGAVYSRFDGKADLFLALLEERITQRIAEMSAVAAEEHGMVEHGTAMGRQWDAKLRTDEAWSLLLIEFRLHAAREPAVNRRYAALHGKLRAAMAAMIAAEADESGEALPVAATDVARAALVMGTGAVLERAAEGAAFPADFTQTMTRALVRGLRDEATVPPHREARRTRS
jgi:AcrR family transcriptional regulator